MPHIGSLGILVSAADAISASRPGARSETVMTYIKRVEDLERIGMSFPGVEKCFALQAGRELRVMVQPAEVTDEQAYVLARNIARKIEEELAISGPNPGHDRARNPLRRVRQVMKRNRLVTLD